MNSNRLIVAATALTITICGPAWADPATPKRLGPCDGAYLSATGLTDYRFDGFSESNRRPTWQVTAYCYRNDGLFAGTMLTGIDFEDAPRTPLEADWYVGRQMRWRGASVTVEAIYDSFPGKRAPGPSYDILEPQIVISRPFKRLTLDALAGWETSVSGAGQEWHLKGGASYAVAPWLSVGGHAGRFFAASGADHDYSHWDVGATATWRRLTLDARYGGTDRPLSQCFFTDWCKPGAYASLTYRVYP